MIKQDNSIEIDEPIVQMKLSNADLLLGKPLEPIKRLQVISPGDFEDLVREWASGYLKQNYIKVKRCGGAGDMGRDVIAYVENDNKQKIIWDNYQCKYYSVPLSPSQIWIELGKLCYYTFNKEFSIPRKYYFVTSKGVSTTLTNLIDKPDLLKKKLIEVWDSKCTNQITNTKKVKLEGKLLEFVNNFDFSIIDDVDPQELIEQHSQTKYFFYRFGGIHKTRSETIKPPTEINAGEVVYVQKLLEAYTDASKKSISNVTELTKYNEYTDHFFRQRKCFYSAESLMRFERDIMPPGTNAFEELKEEVYDGIIDIIDSKFEDGFKRVKEVTKVARTLQTPSYPLINSLKGNDLAGMCHHLVNEKKFNWVGRNND